MHRISLAVVLALALSIAALTAGAAVAASPETSAADSAEVKKTERLREAVTPAGILAHAREFQRIADANGDTRASGTPGYDASVDYVTGKLRDAGYDVTIQPFTFELFTENSPAKLEQRYPDSTAYVNGEDFVTMEYSGSGEKTADVQVVDTYVQPSDSSTSGCEPEDFAGFEEGNIALMQRGSCTFATKAENAENAGAVAALIFNRGTEGNTGVINGTLGEDSDVNIPALGLDYGTGADLADPAGTRVHVFTDTAVETKETANVLADTPGGRDGQTVVIGAHLDSVPEGPGINDNGSGSAVILETALQMSRLHIKPRNRVRFAFWGAEESGLIGSSHYVSQLSQGEIENIALNLNFDMLGSPNYARLVYDGDGSATGPAGPEGSAQIEQAFNDYFASQDLETDPTPFSGRSDYGPFIAVGIPAGGLFSGAEGVKTGEQAAVYGGVAGASYDPCYHRFCDSLTPVADGAEAGLYAQLHAEYDLAGNLNIQALDELSDGAAHATLIYAQAAHTPGDEPVGPGKGPQLRTYKGPHPVR